ncbi:MAG: ribosome silencing factor [Clostridia bacterium]|nr:ribosome silencing factor [Clostridia bacterium]
MLTQDILENSVKILDNKKAIDIVALKINEVTSVADYFVIVSGTSTTHVKALAEELEDKLSEMGQEPKHIEGKATGWILLDYGNVVVHVFTPDQRENFNLEKLWQDADTVDISEWIKED